MMFPGHPHLEQEKHRAEREGEQNKRRRIETLIRLGRESCERGIREVGRKLMEDNLTDRVLLNERFEAIGAKRALEALERKVRSGATR